jgi:hypothetical protein
MSSQNDPSKEGGGGTGGGQTGGGGGQSGGGQSGGGQSGGGGKSGGGQSGGGGGHDPEGGTEETTDVGHKTASKGINPVQHSE